MKARPDSCSCHPLVPWQSLRPLCPHPTATPLLPPPPSRNDPLEKWKKVMRRKANQKPPKWQATKGNCSGNLSVASSEVFPKGGGALGGVGVVGGAGHPGWPSATAKRWLLWPRPPTKSNAQRPLLPSLPLTSVGCCRLASYFSSSSSASPLSPLSLFFTLPLLCWKAIMAASPPPPFVTTPLFAEQAERATNCNQMHARLCVSLCVCVPPKGGVASCVCVCVCETGFALACCPAKRSGKTRLNDKARGVGGSGAVGARGVVEK